MPTASYELRIDWNGNGSYSDTGEDVTARVRLTPPVRWSRGRDQIRALAPPAAGRFDAELDNRSRDYSPENTASPLFGKLLPGRRVRWRATHNTTTYPLWLGVLDDLPQHPERERRSVGIPCLGVLSTLVGQRVSTALYQNIRTDQALGLLLDAVGWPSNSRVLNPGQTIFRWWWLDNQDAFQAAAEIWATEGPGAALYEDGQGRIVFEGRHYRATAARSATSQATLRDTGTEPCYSAPLQYNPGLKDVINACTLTVRVRSVKSVQAVWSLGTGATLTLSPGETRSLIATASDPFLGAITPVAGTDYTVTAGSLSSVSLDRTSGARVTITLVAGANGATITGLQLRAQPVTVDSEIDIGHSLDTSASRAAFGLRPYTLSIRAEIDPLVAQDLANAVVSLYQEPRPTVSLVLVGNAHDARMTQCLSREISDRVTVVEQQTGINGDYFIERLDHELGPASVHRTTFGLEKADVRHYFVLDSSALDGADVLGF